MLKDLKQDGDRFIDVEGCSWETKASYIFTGVLPSCGCGDPASIGKYVLDMLTNYVSHDGEGPKITPRYEDLPVMFFLSWADREGYTEHGSTVRCSWISDKGKELIVDLKEVLAEEAERDAKEDADRAERDKNSFSIPLENSVGPLETMSEETLSALKQALAIALGVPKGYLGTPSPRVFKEFQIKTAGSVMTEPIPDINDASC